MHTVTIGGGVLGAICFICLSAIIFGVFWKFYNRRGMKYYTLTHIIPKVLWPSLELSQSVVYCLAYIYSQINQSVIVVTVVEHIHSNTVIAIHLIIFYS